ncbi:immunity 8 family protein [Qipengyuania aurantiaca]|uniref:Immunity 8 family protein n=1 Tax=Qipengyuania aurantiaca TaxID=2867233 RepID=A0ABX8ZHW5_9SPHN|nr:Imm8 family immunity protein [Qipengyuania aurantiaca]QZD88616.1 immunity 8 family protein [Qipengyuania aurantiaca]
MFRRIFQTESEETSAGPHSESDAKHAELKTLFGNSGELLEELQPIGGCFCHTLRAEIGVRGENGADAFEFDVCSPEFLENETESYPVFSGQNLIITRRFNAEQIEEFVRKRLRHATGKDWNEIAGKINNWARWEFEDYRH